MNIGFIDYCHPKEGFPNRDQTGGFGSGMYASGIVGRLVSRLKKNVRIPVLMLAYLNAIAKKNGCRTSVYIGEPSEQKDLIIIASSMMHYLYELELAKKIKVMYPKTLVGFIGPFVTEFPEKFESDCDFVILGEPEDIFAQVCKGEVEAKGRLRSYGSVDVNNLPFPDWSEFSIEDNGYSPALPRKPMLTIQGSRGCPFACEFCPYLVLQGAPLRRRDNESIVSEIEELVNKYGIKSLLFRDITWSMNKKLTKELCRLIAGKDFDLDIGVETRADTLDSELIKLMALAGVKSVNLGIESPDDKVVLASGRVPIKEDKQRSTIRELEALGIKVQGFYIIGLIDDTVESIERTIAYSHALNTFTAQFCVLTPFPGTKTFNDLQDRLLTTDFSQYTEYKPVVRLDNVTSEQIESYLDKAYNTYYFRVQWFLKNGMIALKGFLRV